MITLLVMTYLKGLTWLLVAQPGLLTINNLLVLVAAPDPTADICDGHWENPEHVRCCKDCLFTITPEGKMANRVNGGQFYFLEGQDNVIVGLYTNANAQAYRVGAKLGLKVVTVGLDLATGGGGKAAAKTVGGLASKAGDTLIKNSVTLATPVVSAVGDRIVGGSPGASGAQKACLFSNILGRDNTKGFVGQILDNLKTGVGVQLLDIYPLFTTTLNIEHPQAVCTNSQEMVRNIVTVYSTFFDNVDMLPLSLTPEGLEMFTLRDDVVGSFICFGIEKTLMADGRRVLPLLGMMKNSEDPSSVQIDKIQFDYAEMKSVDDFLRQYVALNHAGATSGVRVGENVDLQPWETH